MSDTGYLDARDGLRLFFQVRHTDDARAVVVIVHGFSEHSGRYEHVVDALAGAGFAVVTFDCRGHGQSGGRPGYLEVFGDYVSDTLRMIELSRARLPGLPVFLLGHSQGGLVAMTLALDHADEIDGLVVTSPACGVAVVVPAWKELLAVVAARIVPSLAIPSGLDPSLVSRDPEVVEAYASDPLIPSDARAGWYVQFRGAQDRLAQEAHRLSSPILMLLAGEDKIADSRAAAAVFEAVGSQDKTLETLDGLYHEILNEPERDQVLADVCKWLQGHIP